MSVELAKRLRDEAQHFEEAAKKLREVANILDSPGNNGTPQTAVIIHGTRLEQISDFLRHHGPSSRQEVMQGLSDIPRGTIAALLNSKHFERTGEGLWCA